MRSDSRARLEDPDAYFDAIASTTIDLEQGDRIRQLETSILTQPVNNPTIDRAQNGQSGVDTVTNYLGQPVLSAYTQLDIRGVNWIIISEINQAEIFAPVAVFARRVLISAAGLVFLITLASLWLARAFLKPVNQLSEGFRRLAAGHQEAFVEVLADDELGELAKAFNHMVKKNYKANALVAQKTQETEALLLNMFPASVAKRIRKGENLVADEAESVTVIFMNVLNFQRMTEALKPKQAIEILNELVKALDEATESHGVEKIKTTGSEYLAVSGLSVARLDHAKRVIDFAAESFQIVAQINREWKVDLKMRIGVHTGEVIAGTVGTQRLIYDIWGDTVITAHHVQSAAEPSSIYVTEAVVRRLSNLYEFAPVGDIEPRKGKSLSVFRVNILEGLFTS
nr:adenylate/guanylate cyclase domain-containing protein [cf. Phormidesmis sp. LEGE 11477]